MYVLIHIRGKHVLNNERSYSLPYSYSVSTFQSCQIPVTQGDVYLPHVCNNDTLGESHKRASQISKPC
jgi:hypothetical protein